MNQDERGNDYEESLRVAMDGQQASLWTALPGEIVSFDPVKMTAVVQPTVQALVRNAAGAVQWTTLPTCLDVPVCFPRGGGCTFTFPIAENDEVLIVFASRCIDSWWQSGGVQVQAEMRMHDLSDGFAIPGPFSQKQVIQNVSTTRAQLRSNDGLTYFELDPNAKLVNIVAPGGCSITTSTLNISATSMAIDAAVAMTGTVTNNGVDISSTHGHDAPDGGGLTGFPVTV